jgi:pectate lyase
MLHGKDTDNQPSPGMYITYHHNFFDTVTRRGPQFSYGKADFFNNYQHHWYEYGAASLDEAQFLSENNIYEAREGLVCIIPCPDPSPHGGANDFLVSKKALVNDWAVDQTVGYTRSAGDWLINGAEVTVHEPQEVFSRSDFYTAVPEPADPALKALIQAGAGPRTDWCQ